MTQHDPAQGPDRDFIEFIVKQIVKSHRGKIQILDNLPVGTIFKITLPS